MYNAEIKTKFIQQYTKSESVAKFCITVFNQCERFEEQWGNDLCIQGMSNLQDMINSIAGIRHHSQQGIVRLLRSYVDWCVNAGISTQNNINGIEINGLEKIRTQMVSMPFQLQQYLDTICHPETDLSVDNVFRCYLWLAYMGIEEEDVVKLTIDDVDLVNMHVVYNDMKLPIYHFALPAFKNCVELNQFASTHPLHSTINWIDRANSRFLLRGVNDNTVSYLRTALSRRSKANEDKTTLRLSYKKIQMSGLFYRMYEREKTIPEYKVDFSSTALQLAQKKSYDLKTSLGHNSYLRTIREFKKDYQKWKLAFSL